MVTSSGLPHSDSTPQREEQSLSSEKQSYGTKEQTKEQSIEPSKEQSREQTKEQSKEQTKERTKEEIESLQPKQGPTDKRLEDVEGK